MTRCACGRPLHAGSARGELRARCRDQWQHVKGLADDAPAGWNALGYMLPSGAGTAIQPSNFEKAWNGYTTRRTTARGPKVYQYEGFKRRTGWPAALTLHSLRSFVATTLEDVDTPQRTISHILGHGAKNVTGFKAQENTLMVFTNRVMIAKLSARIRYTAIQGRTRAVAKAAAAAIS